MKYVNRLASANVASRYPLYVAQSADWQQVDHTTWSLEVELPEIPADHIIVPSFAMAGDATYAFRFTLCTADAEFALNPVPAAAQDKNGDNGKPPAPAKAPVSCHIDCWHTQAPIAPPRLRLAVTCAARPDVYLLTLSVRPVELPGEVTAVNDQAVALAVPAHISQMQAAGEIKHRICSPTALAMALSVFDDAPAWQETVTACYDPLTRAYGAWPLAIQWASKHGIMGAVEALADWQDALTILSRGTPLVCSIRFAQGKLAGAPLQQTGGHLVLLYGVEGDEVMVRDPAAASDAEVDRRYQLEEFSEAWLRRRGAAYVFCQG